MRPGRAIQLGKRFGYGAQQDEGCLSVRAAKSSTNHVPRQLPPSARIDVNCVIKMVLASLSVVCQNVLLVCHCDLGASAFASRAPVRVSPACSAAKADCTMQMLVPCQIVADLASVMHSAFTKQVFCSIPGLSRQVRPCCAIQVGTQFGYGAKQDEGCIPVGAAKSSANHILIRWPLGTSIDCANKLVLASLSIVCWNALLTLRLDLAASPTAFRARVGASPELSSCVPDGVSSVLQDSSSTSRSSAAINFVFKKVLANSQEVLANGVCGGCLFVCHEQLKCKEMRLRTVSPPCYCVAAACLDSCLLSVHSKRIGRGAYFRQGSSNAG